MEQSCTSCEEYARLSRRGFVAASGAAIAAAAAAPAWLPRVSFARSHRSSAQDVVVQVYLRGGCDGLSIVVPWNETNYQAARPNLKVLGPGGGVNSVIDLVNGNTAASPTAPGGQVAFGFHSAMAPLLGAYQDGKLAVVQACGLTNTNKSHFDAQRFMEVGRANELSLATGWLGRHIASVDPMVPGAAVRAIGVADGLQRTLVGAPGSLPVKDLQNSTGTPPALNNFTSFGLQGNTSTRVARGTSVSAMYQLVGDPLFSSAESTFATIELLNQIGAEGYTHSIPAGNNPAAYPTTSLGNSLKSTAALIDAQVGVEAVAIDYGGWDTHAGQGTAEGTVAGTSMHTLLTTLCEALSAFYADLIVGKGRNVVVVVMSEFGRRIGENGTLGTDHGYGNVMFVLGGAVAGGRVVTNWPGVTAAQPATGQDLGVTIDYRDVLAEIVSKRLGNPAALPDIFPAYAWTDRGIIA